MLSCAERVRLQGYRVYYLFAHKGHPQKWDPKSLQFMSVQEIKGIQDVFDIQSHTHFLHRVDANKHPILLSRSYHVILFDFERSRRALAQFNPRVLYLPIRLAAITIKR
jgi:hypothetical protein